ncbi:DUF2207 domain-containing protein [Roseibium algae]|uniref:DUF2207 domain-containing protein n=1 Tax=Roseibium algae TaxID=3123038 RepID=A0ABU8TH28_9HYPH
MTFRQFWVPRLTAIFFAVCVGQAHAGERIHRFVSNVEVAKSGTLTVTETITVRAEGDQIEHGIFRDIPLTAKDAGGWSYQVGFKLLSVLQDGATAPYVEKLNGQGVRIFIGDADVFLNPGDYTYTIQYEIGRQIRFFDAYDEVYWNVTGNEWAFPIDEAIARVVMPDGAGAEKWVAYTGVFGSYGDAYSATVEGDGREVVFVTSKPLDHHEGLTVVVAFPKGFAVETSENEKLLAWFQGQRVLVIGSLGLAVLFVYYLATWWMVGRDPQKGVIFPRFKAPESVSPALAIYRGSWVCRLCVDFSVRCLFEPCGEGVSDPCKGRGCHGAASGRWNSAQFSSTHNCWTLTKGRGRH